MTPKHPKCNECCRHMIKIGVTRQDVRTAIHRHAKFPTQRTTEAVREAQAKMRESLRLFDRHLSEGPAS